jgi:hypothetical protein
VVYSLEKYGEMPGPYEGVFRYAHNDLKKDKAFVLEVLKVCGWDYLAVSDELQQDEEVLLAALKSTTSMVLLAWVGTVQENKALMLAAVKMDGQALEYASKELQADEEVVLSALLQSLDSKKKPFPTALEELGKLLTELTGSKYLTQPPEEAFLKALQKAFEERPLKEKKRHFPGFFQKEIDGFSNISFNGKRERESLLDKDKPLKKVRW